MLGRSVGVVATSALGAAAFLIPAGIITPHHHELQQRPQSLPPANPSDQTIRVPCSDCVFYTKEEDIEKVETQEDLLWIQGGTNDVLFRFTTSPDGQSLRLSDKVIYPPAMANPEAIELDQVSASAEWMEIVNHETKITPARLTGLSVIESAAATPFGDEVIVLKIDVFELENYPVTIEPIVVHLMRERQGEISIMGINNLIQAVEEEMSLPPPHPALQPFEAHREHPHPPMHDEECGPLPAPLCRLRNVLKSKFAGPRHHGKGGCRMRKPDHEVMARPPFHLGPPEADVGGSESPREEFDDAPRPHHGHGHRHHGHHGHHHHHHRGHRLMHGVLAGIAAALIPTLFGVLVGITVSVIGVVIARLMACVWIAVVHGGRQSIRLEGDVPMDAGESDKIYVEEEEEVEPLPVYEDAPAYEEPEKMEQA